MNYLRIKDILKEKGMSGKELATRVNMTENGLSLIVSGKSQPRFSKLRQIADELEVDIRDLFRPTKAENTAELYFKDKDGTEVAIGSMDPRKFIKDGYLIDWNY